MSSGAISPRSWNGRDTLATEWSKVRHFKRMEWQKNPEKVLPDVVYLMDEMRAAAGVPIVIHVAWDTAGHEPDSTHYTTFREYALGVDYHFAGWSLLDQWLFAERFPWLGIGVYPYWNHPGLHSDLNRRRPEHPNLGRRWWRNMQGEYRALDKELLRTLLGRAEMV